MSTNGVGSPTSSPEKRRTQASRWLVRLLFAFVICVLIILFFFTTNVVSR